MAHMAYCNRVIRLLADYGLINQTSHGALPHVSWDDDIILVKMFFNPHQGVALAGCIPDTAVKANEDYLYFRDYFCILFTSSHVQCDIYTLNFSGMLPWNIQNTDVFKTTKPKDCIRDGNY